MLAARKLMSARSAILAAGDAAALLVFTIVGLVNHEGGISVARVLEVLAPILAVGGVAAAVFGTYREPGVRSLLPAWAIAVPPGILIRKALFGEPATWRSTGIFIGVALAFTLLFLLAWRLVARFTLFRDRARSSA